MTMLKFLVDGGSGVAYVLAEEIAAVIPARPDSPDGAQIVLRTGQGLTVLNDCAEVAADWAEAVTLPYTGEALYRVPRDGYPRE